MPPKRETSNATTSRSLKRKATADPEESKYREPEGPRKSRRIAGKAAEPAVVAPEPSSRSKGRKKPLPVATEATRNAPAESATPPPEPTEAAASQSQDIEGVSAPVEKFLGVLASTVGMHKTVRRLTNMWTSAYTRVDQVTFEKDGLVDLQARIKAMEAVQGVQGEGVRKLRDDFKQRNEQFGNLQKNIPQLTEAMNDLNAQHSESNSELYNFADIPRDHPALKILPNDFWTMYDRCNSINTRCKQLEAQIQTAKQGQQHIRQAFTAQIQQSLLQIAAANNENSTVTPLRETVNDASTRIRYLGSHSVNLAKLNKSLDEALDHRYQGETRLNGLAEKAFIDAGVLEAEKDVKELGFHRRNAKYTKA